MYSFSLALDGSKATVEDTNALYDVCDGVQLRSIGGTAFVDVDCERPRWRRRSTGRSPRSSRHLHTLGSRVSRLTVTPLEQRIRCLGHP